MKAFVIYTLCLFALCSSAFAQINTLAWANQIGGEDKFSRGSSVVLDASGNPVTAGHFQGTAEFSGNPLDPHPLTSTGTQDGYVLFTLSDGTYSNVIQFGGVGAVVDVKALIKDDNQNLYVTGFFTQTCDFDPGAGTSPLSAVGSFDAFVLKLNSLGEFQWVRKLSPINASGYAYGTSLAYDPSGFVIASGIYAGQALNADPGGSDFSLALQGNGCAYIEKLSVNGSFVWAQSLTTLSGNASSAGVITDVSGNIYVNGNFSSEIIFDQVSGTSVASAGLDDIFICKYNSSGSLQWGKIIGGSSVERSYGIAVDNASYVYITGSYKTDQIDFDPSSSSSFLLSNEGETADKGFVEKLDQEGNFVWVLGFGGNDGSNQASIGGIGLDPNGYLYAVGYYQVIGVNGPGVPIEQEGYINQISPAGQVLSVYRFGHIPGDFGSAFCVSVAATSSGDLFVSSNFFSQIDFDASASDKILTTNSMAYNNGALMKLTQQYPCLVVTNTLDNGDNLNPIPGSLRAAVNCVNAEVVHATISFAIPQAGPFTITTSGPPLVITNAKGVTIDAGTQLSSGVGSGNDQSVTLRNGMFILSDAGPSSISNMSFANSPFGINAFSDSITIENNTFTNSAARISLSSSVDSNKVLVRGNTFNTVTFGLDAQFVNNLRIENNIFTGVSGIGIRALNSKQIHVLNNSIEASPAATALSIQACTTVTVLSNSINGGAVGMSLVSIHAGSAKNNTILNTNYGIQYSLSDYTLDNNTIKVYSTGGIYPYAAGALVNTDVTNNTVTQGVGTAIFLTISDGLVANNHIDTCTVGIEIASNQGGATNTSITNNKIRRFTSKGMDLGQSTNLTLFNNEIGNGTGPGIYITRGHLNLVIHRNFIGMMNDLSNAPISGVGMMITPMQGISAGAISHNHIGNLTPSGTYPTNQGGGTAIHCISLGSSSNIKIRANFLGRDSLNATKAITNNGVYMQFANAGANMEVSDNAITAGANGILTDDCEEVLIKQNRFVQNTNAIVVRSSTAGQGNKNKIQRNNFELAQLGTLIILNTGAFQGNDQKQPPTVLHYSPAATGFIRVSGNASVQNDTVEVYVSRGLSFKNITYATYAVTDASGNWTTLLSKSFLGDTPTQQDPTAIVMANATDVLGNTSTFNFTYPLPVSFCSSTSLNNLPATQSFCSGDLLIIQSETFQNVSSYAWYNNATNQLMGSANQLGVTQAGTYRLDITDGFGCTASDTVEVIAKVLPTAAEFLMASEAGIGDEVLVVDISLMDRNSLTWDFGNATVTSQTYGYNIVFTDLGYHEVKVSTTQDGCTSTTSHFINIGTESKAGEDGKVYPYIIKDATAVPNPSNGLFNLNVALTQSKNVKVEVLNFMGMLVNSQSTVTAASDFTLPMDLSSYSAGTYIIRIICDNDSRVLRVMKEN